VAVYIVVRENPYLKYGTYVEDHGAGMVSPVSMRTDDEGYWAPYKQYGLLLPLKTVRNYLLRIQGKGLDEQGLKELRHGT